MQRLWADMPPKQDAMFLIQYNHGIISQFAQISSNIYNF